MRVRRGTAPENPNSIDPSTGVSRSASVRPKFSSRSIGDGAGGESWSGSVWAWTWPTWRYQLTIRTTPAGSRGPPAGAGAATFSATPLPANSAPAKNACQVTSTESGSCLYRR